MIRCTRRSPEGMLSSLSVNAEAFTLAPQVLTCSGKDASRIGRHRLSIPASRPVKEER